MILGMQPSHHPAFPFPTNAYNQPPFHHQPLPTAFVPFPSQPPTSCRTSRKRGHAAVDHLPISDSISNGGVKRQEIQHNVPLPPPPPPPSDDSHPTSQPPLSALNRSSSASMRPTSPLVRCASPAGSDMSMTDADALDSAADELPSIDEPSTEEATATSLPSAGTAEQSSDFYHSAASIRPVLPIQSLHSSAILALYKQQQQQQQQHNKSQHADDDEHDPSKQLVLYQPVQPLAQLAAMGNGGRRRSAAARRAQAAEVAANGGIGLYEWGEIGDNAMQT